VTSNSDAQPAGAFRPKKSVALSGVTAGNTALCTVGRTGNDLHYRGYDILDIATQCEFEEIAHLLVHETLPNRQQLAAYKFKLKGLRVLPAAVTTVLEQLPAASHPMDVLRTGVSALGCCIPEANQHAAEGARDLADRLLACLGSMLCYWHHYATSGRRIEVQTDDDSIGAHFLHLLHGRKPSASWVRAMHTSLNLYAEHEFNASTFTARVIAGTGSDIYSCVTGAIGALRGPKHGGANEVAFEIATPPRMRPRRISAAAWPRRKSSSASVIRSTPCPIRAIKSSKRCRAASRAKPARCWGSRWPSGSKR
jgi:2-methylcitrate synthase